MGLFDMFKSDSGEKMTPHLAFATSLLYMMSADGEMDNEEVGHLLSVLGGQDDGRGTIGVGAQNQALLDSALYQARRTQRSSSRGPGSEAAQPAQMRATATVSEAERGQRTPGKLAQPAADA